MGIQGEEGESTTTSPILSLNEDCLRVVIDYVQLHDKEDEQKHDINHITKWETSNLESLYATSRIFRHLCGPRLYHTITTFWPDHAPSEKDDDNDDDDPSQFIYDCIFRADHPLRHWIRELRIMPCQKVRTRQTRFVMPLIMNQRISEVNVLTTEFEVDTVPPERGKLLKVLGLLGKLVRIRWNVKAETDPEVVSWLERERPDVSLSVILLAASGSPKERLVLAPNPPTSSSIRSLEFRVPVHSVGYPPLNLEAVKDTIISNSKLEKLSISFSNKAPRDVDFGFKDHHHPKGEKKEHFPTSLKELRLSMFQLTNSICAQLDGHIHWDMLRSLTIFMLAGFARTAAECTATYSGITNRLRNLDTFSLRFTHGTSALGEEFFTFISSIKALKYFSVRGPRYEMYELICAAGSERHKGFDRVIVQHSKSLVHLDISCLYEPAWSQFHGCSIGVRSRHWRWLGDEGKGEKVVEEENLACHIYLELYCPLELEKEREKLRREVDGVFNRGCEEGFTFTVEGKIVDRYGEVLLA
ncbi:hypothetical protein FQN54_004979 [Arachnomyces sp. PD_36]|nr:hypothetical protein FQN54_004979 [Arachnomyces sp. PD_36]